MERRKGTPESVNSRGFHLEGCPECGSSNIVQDYDNGEVVCGRCGLVIWEYIMDKGPEWRAFTMEERNSRTRVGTPTSFSIHDKGLSTAIGRIDRDALGRVLPLSSRPQMLRLYKWQVRSRVHSSLDRNLAQAMSELDRLSDKLHVPNSVKEKAALIYRKALDKGLVRGRSIDAIAAASLYVACRTTRTVRTLRELAESSLVDKKEIARCYRLLLREMEIQTPIADPAAYLSKIAGRINISGETQGLAMSYIRKAKSLKVAAGKDPLSLAASALYLACVAVGEKKTQKDVAHAANVTEVTIRNRCKSLKKQLNLDLPD